jgi:galactokinase
MYDTTQIFMKKQLQEYFAPGRVNLIGEHIDYNGGAVLPIALDLGITASYKRTDDDNITLLSATHNKRITFSPGNIPSYQTANDWCNYPIGVIADMKSKGISLSGFEIKYDSTLPEGSGLSSSAAIEVLTGFIILHQAGLAIDLPELAVRCRKVENNFIGVQCGIMDQFAVANCKKDHALLLRCDTLAFEHIPFEPDDYTLLVIDSRKPRSLIKSAYNERKAESDEALRILIQAGKLSNAQHLVDAGMEDVSAIADLIIRRRARHVVSENLRVRQSVTALRMGDLHTFGRLMNASHQSMKEDYEITGMEMDMLAETAQHTDGCIGARMTGGGFGGCVIALVKRSKAASFTEIVAGRYHSSTGLNCEIYTCHAEDGVRVLD